MGANFLQPHLATLFTSLQISISCSRPSNSFFRAATDARKKNAAEQGGKVKSEATK